MAVSALLALAALAGCSEEELFGTGRGATAEVTTPEGVQHAQVVIAYELRHESRTLSDIRASYSVDGGTFFLSATEGEGSDGTRDLAVSPEGTGHVFVWDAAEDLGRGRFRDVRFRITPDAGTTDRTEPFDVHNTVFAVASREGALAGEGLGLWELDLADARLRSVDDFGSGGSAPRGVLFLDGVFYVANSGSGNISALELDDAAAGLVPLLGSPFLSDEADPTRLVSDGDRLFVLHPGDGRIGVMTVESDGGLVRDGPAGTDVVGARALAVRSDVLYVARQAAGEIALFEFDVDDGLVAHPMSPMTAGGLDSPRALAIAGTRLYAANADVPSLAAFRVLADGSLTAISGSPFALTDTGAGELARVATSLLLLAGGPAESLTVLEIDDAGVATELMGSPLDLGAPVSSVATFRDVAVVGTSDSEELASFFVDEAGDLVENDRSPVDAGAPVAGVAVSD